MLVASKKVRIFRYCVCVCVCVIKAHYFVLYFEVDRYSSIVFLFFLVTFNR